MQAYVTVMKMQPLKESINVFKGKSAFRYFAETDATSYRFQLVANSNIVQVNRQLGDLETGWKIG